MAVGLALPCAHDVGRGAVAGLEHRVRVADVGGGRHAHAADQPGGEVGEDVAEHVLGDQHVEVPRPAHQRRRAGIDIDVIGGDIRMLRGALVEDLPEEREGAEDVGLVDAVQHARARRAPCAARASRSEKSNSRCEVLRVITSVSRASSSVTTPLPMEANRPSVDSRMTTRSMPRSAAPTIGLGQPGTSRAGRTPA